MRPLISPAEAKRRLGMIFPSQSFDSTLSNRLAGHAVAAMLYADAVADIDPPFWVRPSTVLWQQTEVLTGRTSDDDRIAWRSAAAKTKKAVATLLGGWGLLLKEEYADTSREPLRDETWRKQHEFGAVRKRAGKPTSYPGPIWALEPHFADLFDPALEGDALTDAIDGWIRDHMHAGARLKAQQARAATTNAYAVDVTLPTGIVRKLEPGPSSMIIKGVVEEWAPRRLGTPVVLTISEPGAKLLITDQLLLTQLGITIDIATILPDALIADVGTDTVEFWVVEAVASDGPITEARKARLLEWAKQQHIDPASVRFLTAFASRGAGPARRHLMDLAVGTFAWYADEPDNELTWHAIA